MPRRRREFVGELWEWGDVPGTVLPRWAPWRHRGFLRHRRFLRGRGEPEREVGLARGEWLRHGHGPDEDEGYGWEFRGGAPRGEHLTWPETVPRRGMSGGRLREELRSDGFPRDRERYEAEGGWTPGTAPPRPRGRRMRRRRRRGRPAGSRNRRMR